MTIDLVIEIYRENALQPGALTAMVNWYRAAVRAQEPAISPNRRSGLA